MSRMVTSLVVDDCNNERGQSTTNTTVHAWTQPHAWMCPGSYSLTAPLICLNLITVRLVRDRLPQLNIPGMFLSSVFDSVFDILNRQCFAGCTRRLVQAPPSSRMFAFVYRNPNSRFSNSGTVLVATPSQKPSTEARSCRTAVVLDMVLAPFYFAHNAF